MFGAILSLGSSALSLFGKKKESDAAAAAAQANEAAMMKEAKYQKWRTGVEQKRLTAYRDKVIARQHVMYAKAGVTLDSVTAQAVFDDTNQKYLMDREILKKEGQFNVERAMAGSAAYAREASNARTTGYLGMARTLLNVGGYAYDQGWLSFGG